MHRLHLILMAIAALSFLVIPASALAAPTKCGHAGYHMARPTEYFGTWSVDADALMSVFAADETMPETLRDHLEAIASAAESTELVIFDDSRFQFRAESADGSVEMVEGFWEAHEEVDHWYMSFRIFQDSRPYAEAAYRSEVREAAGGSIDVVFHDLTDTPLRFERVEGDQT